MIAVGFARLRDTVRARTLCDEALQALELDRVDPVHAYLTAAFVARVEQACAIVPRESPLPDDVLALLAPLSRSQRYKIELLREKSPTLAGNSPARPVESAIARFTRRATEVEESPAVVLGPLDAVFARAQFADPASCTQLAAAFDALAILPEAHAIPLLVPALQRMVATEHVPVVLYERGITIAARFGYGELVPDVLARISGTTDLLVLSPLCRALRRLGLRGELRALLDRLDPDVARPNNIPSAVELTIAGARVWLDDSHESETFAVARGQIAQRSGFGRQELIRAIAAAATHSTMDFGVAQIRHLMAHYERTSDSFGVNSHFCVSVLCLVDTLCLALTDLALADLSLRNPEDLPYFASTYALA